jgi:hypothetical protein
MSFTSIAKLLVVKTQAKWQRSSGEGEGSPRTIVSLEMAPAFVLNIPDPFRRPKGGSCGGIYLLCSALSLRLLG